LNNLEYNKLGICEGSQISTHRTTPDLSFMYIPLFLPTVDSFKYKCSHVDKQIHTIRLWKLIRYLKHVYMKNKLQNMQ